MPAVFKSDEARGGLSFNENGAAAGLWALPADVAVVDCGFSGLTRLCLWPDDGLRDNNILTIERRGG